MTRRRELRCRCCGLFAEGARLCDHCAASHARLAADARRAVYAVWGAIGVERFESQLRADRTVRHRAARIKFLDRRST